MVEWATLTAGEERDLFLTLPANTGGDYVCDFLFGGNAYRRTIRTTGVRKTASGASVALDTRTGGARVAASEEDIAYSTWWCGADVDGSVAVVAVNGVDVSRESGSGTYVWTPTQSGTYELTHTTYANGAA